MERRGNEANVHFAVDRESLRAALIYRGEEWTHYLDLRTGDVRRSRFAGFREDGDELSDEEVEVGIDQGYLVQVDPVPCPEEYAWMIDFVCSLSDTGVRSKLAAALKRRRPLIAFREALVAEPVVRTRWRDFRVRCLDRVVDEWLERHGIKLRH